MKHFQRIQCDYTSFNKIFVNGLEFETVVITRWEHPELTTSNLDNWGVNTEDGTPESKIMSVLNCFDKRDYNHLVREIVNTSGLGSNPDAYIVFDTTTKKWQFIDPFDNTFTLSHEDGLEFFSKYFSAFRDYVHKYAKEELDQPWFKDFEHQLEKLLRQQI